MVTLLNIGNTHTQVGHLEGGRAVLDRVMPTASWLEGGGAALSACPGDGPVLAACVVPAVRERLAGAARRVVFLEAGLVTEVDFNRVDSSTLGADRIANAVAAAALVAGPVVVVDCGTCITTEVLSAGGRFEGGAILPGRSLWRRALCSHTGQLPLVELAEATPAPLGRCTRDAILAGVDLGILGAVGRLVAASRQALGAPDCRVLAVGGDAGYFCRGLPGLEAGGDAFTLGGLARVASRLFAAAAGG
ncbi:MAG: type III pantothenate kinase [Lentisphaerae bacterium]|nr:type III pantothenate kinase [Lentisphaerota bacterium]